MMDAADRKFFADLLKESKLHIVEMQEFHYRVLVRIAVEGETPVLHVFSMQDIRRARMTGGNEMRARLEQIKDDAQIRGWLLPKNEPWVVGAQP